MAKNKSSLIRKWEAQSAERAYAYKLKQAVKERQSDQEYIAYDPKGQPRMFVNLVQAARLGFGWKFYPV